MLYDFLYVFMIFIIYSFFGWIIEMVAVYINDKKIINRGFLLGPYCPIYGFGAFILIWIMSQNRENPIDLFVAYAICASILEYVTSYMMEKLFNARWWDYSHMVFNINGRICLSNTIMFGLLGLFVGYFINPLLINLLDIIPYNIFMFISISISIIFITDFCISFNIVTRLKKNLNLLNRDMTEEVNRQIEKYMAKNHILKAFPLLKQKISNLRDKV